MTTLLDRLRLSPLTVDTVDSALLWILHRLTIIIRGFYAAVIVDDL